MSDRQRLVTRLRVFFTCVQIVSICIWMVAAHLAAQSAWTPVGPAGGDARSFASVPGQPGHLYLGTTTGWLYESLDEGAHWHRLAHLDSTNRLILDNILVDPADPRTIYVGAWRAERVDGGLWVSHDAGKSWTQSEALRGQSIRAMAMAPSDPKTLFAGTLEGVFRSTDGGEQWRQISPKGSAEIHEIESVAVDPRSPDIVYAGTWHLPWKTVDGGKHWSNVKQGLIDDSDVFSILIDPEHPHVVYLSACSGIYKSETAGKLFHKIQGIPADARRTRVLRQDPAHRETVYAGTTQGLYKSTDAGHSFRPMTADNVIVNDIYVDPNNAKRVLLATDRGGVLVSEDGGKSFKASNAGVSGRSVQALLVDRRDAKRLYAGVINDKEFGGAFESEDGGAHWRQIADGLEGRDVVSLAQTPEGQIVAGTNHGIFALETNKAGKLVWTPRNAIANTVTSTATSTVHAMRVNQEKQTAAPVIQLESRADALDVAGPIWVAATSYGVVTSRDRGASWQGGAVLGHGDYLSVASHGALLAAARGDGVAYSRDGGKSWWPMGVPKMLTRIHCVAFDKNGTLWLGTREGAYYTPDLGKSWFWVDRLPLRGIDDLVIDEAHGRVVVSSRQFAGIYAIDPKTMAWKAWSTGYTVGQVRRMGDRLVAASTDDGIILPPATAPELAEKK